MKELELAVINWIVAVERRDSILFHAASSCLCGILSSEELDLLFRILGEDFDEKEKHWIKESLYCEAA